MTFPTCRLQTRFQALGPLPAHGRPRYRQPVVSRRHAVPGTAPCESRGRPVLRAAHRLAAQDHSQGRACGASVAAQPQTLEQ
jgi:hypothetical protein